MKKRAVRDSVTIGIVLIGVVIGGALQRSFAAAPAFAQSRVFSSEELKQYNGQNGNPAFYAYEGVVYDVTDSSLWKNGEHYGLQAGNDLTGQLSGAPHGTEVFKGIPVVGTLQTGQTGGVTPGEASITESYQTSAATVTTLYTTIMHVSWFASMLFFFLTFATAPITPWATFIRVPWRGETVGPDQGDQFEERQPITVLHKSFFWCTLALATFHSCLVVLSLFGITL